LVNEWTNTINHPPDAIPYSLYTRFWRSFQERKGAATWKNKGLLLIKLQIQFG